MSEKSRAKHLAYLAAMADHEKQQRQRARKARRRVARSAKRLAWEIDQHEAALARQRLHRFASLGLPPPAPGHIVLLARRHKRSQPTAATAG